jgi:hypothetical protein
MDPLQFAYCKNRNTEDAILFSLNRIFSHLDKSNSSLMSARIMFFDFSSAFNTIQPHLSCHKLFKLSYVPHDLIHWTLNYLTERSQFVRLDQ